MEHLPGHEFTPDYRYLDAARERALSYGATPLGSDVIVNRQQAEVFDMLKRRIDEQRPASYGDDMDWLHDFMVNNHYSRSYARSQKNHMSYHQRLERDLSKVPNDVMSRTWVGAGDISDQLSVHDGYKMASIELARLSIPYGYGVDDELEQMRDATNEALAGDRRRFEPVDPNPRYKARISDTIMDAQEGSCPKAILMTRKQNMAKSAEDTLIIERTSFVVLLDRLKTIAPEFVETVNDISLRGGNPRVWSEHVTDAWREAKLHDLLHENNFEIIVPLSDTIYAFNKTKQAEIETRDRKELKQKAKDNPPAGWLVAARAAMAPTGTLDDSEDAT